MTLPKKIRIIKEIPGFDFEVGKEYEGHFNKFELTLMLNAGYAEDADKRWKPTYGEKYWYIGNGGEVRRYFWDGDKVDEQLYEFGNVFQTEGEATIYRDKIKKLLTERT